MEITFKSMDLDDLEDTIKLCNECFEENTDLEYAKKVYLETRNDPNNIYLNGVYNGKVIAHAKMTIIRTIYKPMATYAILNHVCVKPEFRRHHLATYMLDVLFKLAKDNNCAVVELWSKNHRIPAHSCYKKYGFELVEAGFFSKEVK